MRHHFLLLVPGHYSPVLCVRKCAMNRLLLLMIGVTLVMLSRQVMAAGQAMWQDKFASGGTADWTLQPPVNALGKIPANGHWAVAGSALVATGTAAPWTICTPATTLGRITGSR